MKCEQCSGDLNPIKSGIQWPAPIGAAGGKIFNRLQCMGCRSAYELEFLIEAGLTVKQVCKFFEKVVD